MSNTTDERMADAIAAIKGYARRLSALADAERAASRATRERMCLLVTALSMVLMLCAVAACVMTAELAVRGILIAVPIFVAVLGLSGALALYVVGAAVAYRSVRTGRSLPARMRFAVTVTMTGQALFMGTALATFVAGVLVAVNGLSIGAVVAAAVALGVAVLGQQLRGVIQYLATA